MQSDTFNKLFEAYYQQAIETCVDSIPSGSVDSNPTWVQMLRHHVQEWKQHYKLQSQAIDQVKNNCTHESLIDQRDFLVSEEAVIRLFEIKRDLIWTRQQQELTTGKFIA